MDNEDYAAIVDRFDSIVDNITMPSSINTHKSYLDSLNISNNSSNRTPSAMMDSIHNIARSLKITPLTYVDESKFYSYVDAAYKIYQQLLNNNDKFSKRNAWLIANIAMFNWYYKMLLGTSLTGREVEREVDQALRSPIYYSIVTCLMGVIKSVVTMAVIYYGTTMLPNNDMTEKGRLIFFGYYIISMIINLIKISIRIYRGADESLDVVKPIIS